MDIPRYRSALIVGTGPGLSASLARLFAAEGLHERRKAEEEISHGPPPA